MSRLWILGVLAVAALLQPIGRLAWADGDAHSSAAESAEERKHELGLFVGVSHREGESGPSAGLDYKYHAVRRFGIGAFLEVTGANFRDGLVGVSLLGYPWRELILIVAPSVEIEPAEHKESFVVRFGAEYGFGLGGDYEVSPALGIDVFDEDVVYLVGGNVSRKL